MKQFKLSSGAALVVAAFAPLALAQTQGESAANPAAELEAPTVEVVGTTPLPGLGTPVNQVPNNVQAITGAALRNQQATELSEFLNNNIGSVNVGSGQANSFMPDFNFRGFTGSPLLGVPQGISAFVDGVRINEAFGDTINWDLIPEAAISTINLVPGSNPVFGLNTLGGALSVNTKSGKEYPGGAVTLQGGSWGRINGTVEYGAQKGNWDFFVAGNVLSEDGWREHSSSKLNQLFGKIGYETSTFDADLSYAFADNRLEGTQTSPLSMLRVDPEMAYTYPDITKNKLDFLNLKLSRVLGDNQILGGNVYYRHLRTNNFSSNTNDEFDGTAPGNLCNGSTPDTECAASNDKSRINTNGFGGTLQYTLLSKLGERDNRLTVGASYDGGRTHFVQDTQGAVLSADRGTIGATEFERDTDVDTNNDYFGLFATDTLALTSNTFLTLSGRYNHAKVKLSDNIGTALNGNHTFNRFNPAVGLNWNPSAMFNTWLGYNEGMRAPSPVELTCADPGAPCKLPNAFLADPPLKPVVSKTFELGTRGAITNNLSYTASAYRTTLRDDIQFVSENGGGLGYFQNVGKTRRQGLELGLDARFDKLTLRAAYGYINAKFLTGFSESNPTNSTSIDTNSDGEPDTVVVRGGDTMPGIPKHNFKIRADYAVTPTVNVGLNVVFASNQFARGDENNQDANGKIPSYTVVNLDARWNITRQWQVFGRINNLFDKDYAVSGVVGRNFFLGQNFTFDPATAENEQFRTPGAPRAFFVGVRYEFGRPESTRTGAGAPSDD